MSNVAAVGAGFLLGDVADVRVSSGAELSGNLESEVREDAALEVCTGVVVSDALGQGGDPDCFRITADGYTDGCGC